MKKLFSLLFAVLAISLIATVSFGGPVGIFEMSIAGGGLLAVSMFLPKLEGSLFETIGLDAARGAFTNAVVAVYRETIEPMSFLRSFFPSTYSRTKLISMDIKRGTEKVAVDILRGTGSNLNTKSRSTLKTLEPPLYAEAHNVNELDVYDTAFGTLDPALMAQLATDSAETLAELRNKIERAKEKQCADVLKSGVITLVSGDNIDFKRKAESMVDGGSGTYWTVNTVDPVVALQAGGDFIRQKGKAQGGVYNVIMGASAFNAMINNTIFKAKYDLKNIDLGAIQMPQRNAVGGTLNGQVSAGSYKFNVWTYAEGYEDSNGDFVKYIDDTDIIILPEVTKFKFAHGLVPQLPGMAPLNNMDSGVYLMNEYVDPKNRNHVQEILSAGVALPVAIDQIYTQKVTAS